MKFNIKTILGSIEEITAAPKGLQDVASHDIQRDAGYPAELDLKNEEDRWRLW